MRLKEKKYFKNLPPPLKKFSAQGAKKVDCRTKGLSVVLVIIFVLIPYYSRPQVIMPLTVKSEKKSFNVVQLPEDRNQFLVRGVCG